MLAGQDPEDYVDNPAWVILINEGFDEELPQWTAEQVPDDETREMMNRGDEGCEPIEVSNPTKSIDYQTIYDDLGLSFTRCRMD